MVRESIIDATRNATRAGKFALMVPVMMFVVGRWVAMMAWIPTARASWAMRQIGSSISLPAVIIRSPNSSIMMTIYRHKAVSVFMVQLAVDKLCVVFLDITASCFLQKVVAGVHLDTERV